MRDFDWQLRSMCVLRISGDRPNRHVENLGSQSSFTEQQKLLEELLDASLASAWRKKPSLSDGASCRVYGFKDGADGRSDRELMESLLVAVHGDFDLHSMAIGNAYSRLQRSPNGELMLISATIDSGRCKSLPFVFLIPLPFQDARTFTEELALDAVPQITGTKLGAAMVFPHWTGLEQDGDHIKVFEAKSESFDNIFALVRPMTAKMIAQDALRVALSTRYGDRFNDYMIGLPPEKRLMFSPEQFVPLNDLLPPLEIQHVAVLSAEATKEKTGKPLKAKIKVDGKLAVDVDLSQLGKSVFVAKKGDQRFIIVRGEQLVGGGALTALDFLEVPELADVWDRVSEEIAGPVEEEADGVE